MRNYGVNNQDEQIIDPQSFTYGFWSGGIVGGIGGILFTLLGVWVLGLIL